MNIQMDLVLCCISMSGDVVYFQMNKEIQYVG